MSELAHSPLIAELREVVQKIALISHIGGTSYEGKIARDTSESVGGRRPPGSDIEPRPRPPKTPPIEGDAASEKLWDEYDEELAAWQACYHRRTPEYFRRELERCRSDARLRALIEEARDTLDAWRKMPMVPGQPPLSVADPQWKRYIAESREDAGVLATRYSVTRRYINKIRQQYREIAA